MVKSYVAGLACLAIGVTVGMPLSQAKENCSRLTGIERIRCECLNIGYIRGSLLYNKCVGGLGFPDAATKLGGGGGGGGATTLDAPGRSGSTPGGIHSANSQANDRAKDNPSNNP